MISLLDINVLMALSWANHPHHAAAHHWFNGHSVDGWATCLPTQTGVLRLSLNPQIVGVPMKGSEAVQLLRGLIAHPQHTYFVTLPELTHADFEPLVRRLQGYRQVSDAVLLAIAKQNQAQFVTFDRAIETLCPWPNMVVVITP
ncbi:MAG: VapC toxin family PIN domain ribonuclease [Planctomycetaceae bacterium]|nr:VapC toxin family PIN domain ribonuclease [Planctomycetaceae bacterium]